MNGINNVELMGTVKSCEWSHSFKGVQYYKLLLGINRASGIEDVIPIMAGEHLKPTADYVHIKGKLISYNEGRSLKVYVMAEHLEEMINIAYMNKVKLDGTVCSVPRYKVLSSGKEITHITLGTPQSYYFPIIVWDEQAMDASHLEFGDKVEVVGRIQSRTYVKDKALHITYEVSTERIISI